MSFTAIGRNKVYASIEDLPENLKLVNGDRLLIQTDNGTALVDWENVKVPADHTDFGDTIDELKSYIDQTNSYFSNVNDRIDAFERAVEDFANEFETNPENYATPEAREGTDPEEMSYTPADAQFPRIKNILTRLDNLEGNANDDSHKFDDNGLISKPKASRIEKIEHNLENIETSTIFHNYEDVSGNIKKEPLEGFLNILKENSDTIEDLTTRITVLEQWQATAKNDLASLQNQINGLQNQINALTNPTV